MQNKKQLRNGSKYKPISNYSECEQSKFSNPKILTTFLKRHNYICWLQGHAQRESKGMEKDSPCKWKPKLEGNRIMIKGSIQQEDIFINIYATKVVAPKYIK